MAATAHRDCAAGRPIRVRLSRRPCAISSRSYPIPWPSPQRASAGACHKPPSSDVAVGRGQFGRHAPSQHAGTRRYLLLIMHYWQTGALPIDNVRLARISGLTIEQWLNVRSTLVQLFDENWRHDRVEHELAEAERRTEKARNAGKQSAKSRAAAATVQLTRCLLVPTKRQLNVNPHNHSHNHRRKEEFRSWRCGANGSPPTPVYTDARHRALGRRHGHPHRPWREGKSRPLTASAAG